jgi:hypothetical protein
MISALKLHPATVACSLSRRWSSSGKRRQTIQCLDRRSVSARPVIIAPRARPIISPATAATVMVMATPQRSGTAPLATERAAATNNSHNAKKPRRNRRGVSCHARRGLGPAQPYFETNSHAPSSRYPTLWCVISAGDQRPLGRFQPNSISVRQVSPGRVYLART